jgi:ribose transport system substrate-binding protein
MASSLPMPRRLLLSCLLPLLALLPACKRGSDIALEKLSQVVLLSANAEHVYELSQMQILMRLISMNPGFGLRTHDAGGDAAKQAEQFATCLGEKPVAILVTPVDVAVLAEQVKAAVTSGVLVIGLGESSKAMPCSTTVSCDQHELGRLAGELAVRALQRKAKDEGSTEPAGRVVELRGGETDAASQARHEGFVAGLKEAPGAIIVHDAPGFWTKQGGQERTTDAMRLQTRFDILYAHNDLMALGAGLALKEQRENVMLIGTDALLGPEGGLTLLNEGALDATIYHPILVDMAMRIILKRMSDPRFAPPPAYRLAPLVITPKNVSEVFRTGYPALPEL